MVAARDGQLRYPHMIGERLGLRISARLETVPHFADRARKALAANDTASAEAEQALLVKIMTHMAQQAAPAADTGAGPQTKVIRPTLQATWDGDGTWLRISGDEMTPALRRRILDYLGTL